MYHQFEFLLQSCFWDITLLIGLETEAQARRLTCDHPGEGWTRFPPLCIVNSCKGSGALSPIFREILIKIFIQGNVSKRQGHSNVLKGQGHSHFYFELWGLSMLFFSFELNGNYFTDKLPEQKNMSSRYHRLLEAGSNFWESVDDSFHGPDEKSRAQGCTGWLQLQLGPKVLENLSWFSRVSEYWCSTQKFPRTPSNFLILYLLFRLKFCNVNHFLS